jgi:hypothetical protein
MLRSATKYQSVIEYAKLQDVPSAYKVEDTQPNALLTPLNSQA